MKKTFITHPFKDAPKENKKKVDIICKILYKKDILPISPLHMFYFIEKENPEVRELIMETCFMMIAFDAEQLFAFGTEGGCEDEITWAKILDVPVYYKNLVKEDGVYKILDVV